MPRPLFATRIAIWRWHFYAGVLALPIVVLLSITGLIYLFRPQIDAWIDRPYDRLAVIADPAPPAAIVRAALAAEPGARLLAYELPRMQNCAVRVIVSRRGDAVRVYVDPGGLAILKTVREEARFERIVFALHGQLLLGNRGSVVVEIAASWMIVMILTGLCLWWPRNRSGWSLAGILYPRVRCGGRRFWRDMHAVFGAWAAFALLFLLVSGLPWAYAWGHYLQEWRHVAGEASPAAGWQVGHVRAARAMLGPEPVGAMPGMSGMSAMPGSNDAGGDGAWAGRAGLSLDRVVRTATTLGLADPVLVSPPVSSGSAWTVRSDAQDRTLRGVVLVAADGRVLRRTGFEGHPLIDRLVGIGVAVHEGRLFGWLNVVLNAAAALALLLIAASGAILWLGRRRRGMLGAPLRPETRIASWPIAVPIVLLALALPLFGASLLVVWLVERLVLRRSPTVASWLGLVPGARGIAEESLRT